jgi:FMN phosphatase YigB (HAD superfamily)
MDQPFILFLDFDDTLSEQVTFNLQFCRAVGDFLSPIHGGHPEDWARSAIDMLVALEAEYLARFRGAPTNGYRDWLAAMRPRATEMLFTGMGLQLPENPAQLSLEVQAAALPRCNALFPAARECVHALRIQGHEIHMASGNESAHLVYALRGANLSEPIDACFGPDLIDCAKEGPEFYRRIFAHLGLPPDRALIVDNDPVAIGWAHEVGAKAIQVDLLPDRRIQIAEGVLAVITDLNDLPYAVKTA